MPTPHIRLAAQFVASATDGDLLARFARDRDEAAFAALVHRHGSTVLGVCRRVLGQPADAEDAFQAVFLVLAHHADSLVGQSALGGWLHGVAVRVAMQARVAFARRRKHERAAAERRPESAHDPLPVESSWIDQELAALPDKFREPVVLCLLQDRPRAEVAAELGIPEGTLASRLDTARKRLADRLVRYRVPLVFTGLLASVPAAVADAAISRAADKKDMAIHQLANEVTRSMFTNAKWRVLLAAGILTTAVGGLLLAAPAPMPTPVPTPTARLPAPVPEPKEPKWKQEFDKIYTLKDDELVKIIPRSEWPECRKEFLKQHPVSAVMSADEKVKFFESSFGFVFEVNDKGKCGCRSAHSGQWNQIGNGPREYAGVSFLSMSALAGFERYEIEVKMRDFASLNMDNPDFIVRKNAPREKLVPALDKALHEKLNAKFRVELKEVEQEVWVASGTLDFKSRAWRKAGQVDIYEEEKEVVDKSGKLLPKPLQRMEKGGVPVFLKDLEREIETWVQWADGDPPAKPVFEWTIHWRVGPKNPTGWGWRVDHNPEKVLSNVSEQTGLTFKKEKRKVPILVVSTRE